MKNKMDKYLVTSILISALLSFFITLMLALVAWCSWLAVGTIIMMVLIPIVHLVIKVWNETGCMDLDDLSDELFSTGEDEDYKSQEALED